MRHPIKKLADTKRPNDVAHFYLVIGTIPSLEIENADVPSKQQRMKVTKTVKEVISELEREKGTSGENIQHCSPTTWKSQVGDKVLFYNKMECK